MADKELQSAPPDADVDPEVDLDLENPTVESIDNGAGSDIISVNHVDSPQLVREKSSKLETLSSEPPMQVYNSNDYGEANSESKNEHAENHVNEEKNAGVATKASAAMVQVRKKPGGAFGAMLGSSGLKRKENESKLEAIRSCVNLPFRAFSVTDESAGTMPNIEEQTVISKESNGDSGSLNPQDSSAITEAFASKADVIMFDEEEGDSGFEQGGRDGDDSARGCDSVKADFNDDNDDEPTSLSELSLSFQKCLQSIKLNSAKKMQAEQAPKVDGLSLFKPFDYEAAWKDRFGEDGNQNKQGEDGDGNPKRRSARGGRRASLVDDLADDNGSKDLGQGRRRQAFPASGNRSMTFR